MEQPRKIILRRRLLPMLLMLLPFALLLPQVIAMTFSIRHHPFDAGLDWIDFSALLVVIPLGAYYYLMHRVTLSADGIEFRDQAGRNISMPWNAINEAYAFSIFGMRHLNLFDQQNRLSRFSLVLLDINHFAAAVRDYAGTAHPMAVELQRLKQAGFHTVK